jgi:hypothetical protein
VKHYRTFVSEWHYYLHCPTCSPMCRAMPYSGEIDRCFWGALGPQSFLATNKSRYQSFMLANEIAPKARVSRKRSRICVDGFGGDARKVALIHYGPKK